MFSTTSFMFQTDIKLLPSITYPDIDNYLVFNPAPFTAQDMKAFKSLETYNIAFNGWFSDVLWKEVNSVIIIKAKVCNMLNFDN